MSSEHFYSHESFINQVKLRFLVAEVTSKWGKKICLNIQFHHNYVETHGRDLFRKNSCTLGVDGNDVLEERKPE